jgi:hypothetical protein
MIKLHDIENETDFNYYSKPNQYNWEKLKEEFYNMEFSSIISKDKTWEKFKNTFKNLETKG